MLAQSQFAKQQLCRETQMARLLMRMRQSAQVAQCHSPLFAGAKSYGSSSRGRS